MTVAAGARGHHAVELVEVDRGVALERAARGILDAACAVRGEECEEVLDVDLAVIGDVGGAGRALDDVQTVVLEGAPVPERGDLDRLPPTRRSVS